MITKKHIGLTVAGALLASVLALNRPSTPPAAEKPLTSPTNAVSSPVAHTPPPEFTAGVAQDTARAGAWATVRKLHLRREPYCAWCGGTTDLQVHHIHPFALNPTLHGSTAPGGELDDGVDGTGKDGNLITLCMIPKGTGPPEMWDHHETYGHSGHFKGGENLEVRAQCNKHEVELRAAGKWPMQK